MENMLKENTVKQINIYNGNLIPVTKTGLFHFPSSSVWGKSSLRFMPSGTSETIKNYISGNCNE